MLNKVRDIVRLAIDKGENYFNSTFLLTVANLKKIEEEVVNKVDNLINNNQNWSATCRLN